MSTDPRAAKRRIVFIALGLALVSAAWLSLILGDRLISPVQIITALTGGEAERLTTFALEEVRGPRTVVGILAGALLGISGALLQAVLRNPLAAPEVTGVGAGAVLAVVLVLVLATSGESTALPVLAVAAFAGGTVAGLAVYALSRSRGRTHHLRLILTGVMVSAVLSAITSGALIISSADIQGATRWIIGSMGDVGWEQVGYLWPMALIAVVLTTLVLPAANLLQLGDGTTAGLGARPEAVRITVLLVAVLNASAAVAVVGGVAFVGLVAPHLARRLVGGDARVLVPAAALMGGLLLVAADTVSRAFDPKWLFFLPLDDGGSYNVLPVGVFTALLGGPFLLYLLNRRRTVKT